MRGRILCDDLAFLRGPLVNGAGIGYLPPYFAEAEVATGLSRLSRGVAHRAHDLATQPRIASSLA